MKLCSVFTAVTLALAAHAPAWAQDEEAEPAADRLYLERASLRSADELCELFTPAERLALEAGYWQSRGALLRGGFDLDEVEALSAEAESYARNRGCDGETLRASAERLRDAFTAFTRTPSLEYFGDYGSWTASRAESDDWAAVQIAESGVSLGLYNAEASAPPAPAAFFPLSEDELPPASARVFARDPGKSSRAWLGGVFGAVDQLALPPLSISEAYWARDRQIIKAGRRDDGGVVFLFPQALRDRLAELDPREAIWVEFAPSPRATNVELVRATFEVGDFRAAETFSQIPKAGDDAAS